MLKTNSLLFPLWLTLWAIIGLTVHFKNQTNQGKYNLNEIFSQPFNTLTFYLITAIIIWLILTFLFKKLPFVKKLNIKKILILWSIFFLIILFSPFFIKKPVQNQESKKYSTEILTAINKQREKIDLKPLFLDGRLCVFAKKKALDYSNGIDETKIGFSNELKSPANSIYFLKFEKIVLDSLTEGIGQTDEELAKTFMLPVDKGAATPVLTHGCVANSIGSETGRFYTVFIGGVIEKKAEK